MRDGPVTLGSAACTHTNKDGRSRESARDPSTTLVPMLVVSRLRGKPAPGARPRPGARQARLRDQGIGGRAYS